MLISRDLTPPDDAQRQSRSRRRVIEWTLLLATLAAFGVVAAGSHLLTQGGLPLGRKLVFAPWFRGTISYAPDCSLTIARSGAMNSPTPFDEMLEITFEYDCTAPDGTVECQGIEVQSASATDSVEAAKGCRAHVLLRRWYGFFVLER